MTTMTAFPTIRAGALAAAMAAALLATPASAQQRDFDDVPDTEVLRSLLLSPAEATERNIYAPSGQSLVNRPAAPAPSPAPAAQQAAASKPQAQNRPRPQTQAQSRPRPTRPQPTGPCAVYGSEPYVNVRIQFAINSHQVRRRYRDGIARIAQVLAEEPQINLAILGHTDVSGGEAVNRPLSERRAAEVARILVQEHGIAPNRLRTAGRAATQLCYPQAPYAGGNRRVTFLGNTG